MKIAYAKYSLTKGREGALLRCQFEESIGYADCHPWPELGDAPLDHQLKNRNSSLFKRSLYFAKTDAEIRHQKKEILLPKSHHYHPEKSGIAKVKIGNALDQEIAYLKKVAHPMGKLRLDANEKLTEEEFIYFLRKTVSIHPYIDFIEDPFPYHPDKWKKYRSISLACDRQSQTALNFPESQQVLIIKPAIENPEDYLQSKNRFLFTSYLDHPIGQLAAACEAAKYNRNNEICGLNSHLKYPENPYSKRLKIEEERLVFPKEGFDDLLEKEEWVELI